MKLFGAVIILLCLATIQAKLSESQKEKLKQRHRECVTETGVASDSPQKALRGNFDNEPKLKDYFFCMNKKSGIQNDDGQFQVVAWKSKLSLVTPTLEDASKLVDRCNVQKSSPGESALEAAKCLYANRPVDPK